MAQQSITLQTSDSDVVSGDILGRVNFAASNESSGSEAKWIGASVYAEASGEFTATVNPTNLVLATSDADGVTARHKVTNVGHFVPNLNTTYDLGSSSFKYNNVFAATGTLDRVATTGIQLTGSASQSGLLYINNSNLISSSPNVLFSNANLASPKLIFKASGTTTPDLSLNILTTASGTTSGVQTLSIQGSAGELFSITDVLDSGTIFSVNDISGLSLIEADASGVVTLVRYGTNVAVGDFTPTQKLHVGGNLRVSGAIYDSLNSPGTSGQVLVSTLTGTDWKTLSEIVGVDGVGVSGYSARWIDAETISSGIIFDNGTNVGIGTTSPSYRFHLANGAFYSNGDASAVAYYMQANQAIRVASATLNDITYFDSPIINFRNPANAFTTQMYLNSSGLAIGNVTSALSRLYVNTTSATTTGVIVRGVAAQTADLLQIQNSAGTTLLDIDAAGSISGVGSGIFIQRVGVGTSSPSSALDIRSSGIAGLIVQTSNAQNIFQYLKGDGTNLWRGLWDGSNFHHYLTSASLYYNLNNGNFHIDGGGGSNTSYMNFNNRAYIQLNSLTTDAPGNANIWAGPNAYATSGQLTSISPFAFSTWAWNGIDGFTITSRGYLKQTQQSATTGDARLSIVRGTDNVELFTVNYSSGNIGVGTTSPTQKLHIAGNARLTGALFDNLNIPGVSGQVLVSTSGGVEWRTPAAGGTIDGTGSANYLARWIDADTLGTGIVYDNGTNVGIGTASPSTRLHIRRTSGDFIRLGVNDANANGVGGNIEWYTNENVSADYLGGLRMQFSGGIANSNRQMQFLVGDVITPKAVINGTGNMGIGTTSPTAKLHIETTTVATTGVIVRGAAAQTADLLQIQNSAGATLLGIDAAGSISGVGSGIFMQRVGVGISSPATIIHAYGTNPSLRLQSSIGGGTTSLSMGVQNDGNLGGVSWNLSTGEFKVGNTGGNGHYMTFYTGTGTEKVRIDTNGNVGIGTSSPEAKLDVRGTGYFSESIRTSGTVVFASGNTAPVGVMQWDNGEGTVTLGLKGGNVTANLGQDNVVLCYNGTGSSLTKGQVVYVSGAQGQRPSVNLALATTDLTSARTIGVVDETIGAGSEGFVSTFGVVTNINTAAFTAGSGLWLSATTPGALTMTRPVAPNHGVFVGWCLNSHVSAGRIFTEVQNGYELDEIHDVLIQSVASGNLLQYDSSNSTWRNKTAAQAGLVSGTGVPSGIAFFDTESSINSSVNLKWNNTDQVLSIISDASASPLKGETILLNNLYNTGRNYTGLDIQLYDQTNSYSTAENVNSTGIYLYQVFTDENGSNYGSHYGIYNYLNVPGNIGTSGYGYYLTGTDIDYGIFVTGIANLDFGLYIVNETKNYISSNLGIGQTVPTARLHIQNSSATATGIIVRGATSQTADLFRVENSASGALLNINAAGSISGVASGIFGQNLRVANIPAGTTETDVVLVKTDGTFVKRPSSSLGVGGGSGISNEDSIINALIFG